MRHDLLKKWLVGFGGVEHAGIRRLWESYMSLLELEAGKRSLPSCQRQKKMLKAALCGELGGLD